MRTCVVCEKEKPESEFDPRSKKTCLECRRTKARERARERYRTDPEYRAANKARSLAYTTTRYTTDPEWRDQVRQRKRERYQTDPDYRSKVLDKSRAYRQTQLDTEPTYQERRRVSQSKYKTSPKGRANNAKYQQERYQTDIAYQIARDLRSRLKVAVIRAMAHKSANTFDLVGCTIEELMAHLESQFQPGMTWENRAEWHIDHIIPVAAFDMTDPEQQRACFHYTNLQPLWATENLSKGARILDDAEVPAIIRDVMGDSGR